MRNKLTLYRPLVVNMATAYLLWLILLIRLVSGNRSGSKCGWCGAVQRSSAVPDAVLRARSHQQHLRFEGVGPAKVWDITGQGWGRRGWGRWLQAGTILLSVHLPGCLLGPPLQSWLWDHFILDRPGGAPAHCHRPRHQTHHPAPPAWHQLPVGVHSMSASAALWFWHLFKILCRIRIQALNSLGAGPFSHTFKLKTKPLPPQPPRLECTAFSHQTLRLKWGDGPAKASTSDALQYQLQMEDKSGRSVVCQARGSYPTKEKRIQKLLSGAGTTALYFLMDESLCPFSLCILHRFLMIISCFFIADLYPCIKDHATHTKSRGLMSLPLTRSASRPLTRRAKGPSPLFTHSPPRSLLLPLWKVWRAALCSLLRFCLHMCSGSDLSKDPLTVGRPAIIWFIWDLMKCHHTGTCSFTKMCCIAHGSLSNSTWSTVLHEKADL